MKKPNIKKSYKEYQSGGWHTFPLYSPNENNTNEITDGNATPNPIMDQMPAIKEFLDKLGLDYFSVRVAKSDPIELGAEQKLRLHIPLVTNPDANMQIAGTAVNMKDGFIWKLNPTADHATSNTSKAAYI